MRLVGLVLVLLIMGCQDGSKNKLNTDAVSEKQVAEDQYVEDESVVEEFHGIIEEDEFMDEEPQPEIPATSPVKINVKLNPAWAEYGMAMIEVQAVTDNVTIQNVVINRGQCTAIERSNPLPVKLSFGRVYTAYINDCVLDKIIEVQIGTNMGDWTFN